MGLEKTASLHLPCFVSIPAVAAGLSLLGSDRSHSIFFLMAVFLCLVVVCPEAGLFGFCFVWPSKTRPGTFAPGRACYEEPTKEFLGQ
jgi:hypothetical protein